MSIIVNKDGDYISSLMHTFYNKNLFRREEVHDFQDQIMCQLRVYLTEMEYSNECWEQVDVSAGNVEFEGFIL